MVRISRTILWHCLVNKYTNVNRRRDINEIKETCGYVAQDFEIDCQIVQQETYLLPDSVPVKLASEEKYICDKRLFRLHGEGTKGIHNLVINAIYRSPTIMWDVDLHKTMERNIVLGGGSTLFRGLAQRVMKEMKFFFSE